ncbi:MAG: ABC transporter permease [Candidatus Sumerlaeaceae bacterium]
MTHVLDWLTRGPLAVVVLLYQSVALALGQIWTNKLRSILTMLGIIIGVASVTGVIAALTGLKQKVLADFETVGTNKIFIWPDRPETGPYKNASWRQLQFKPRNFDNMLSHCPSVRAFSRTTWNNQRVRHLDKSEESVGIQGIEPAWHSIENRSVKLGRPFSVIDNTQGRAVCLINPQAQQKLALPQDCVGESILIGDRRYTVVGVVEPPQQMSLFGGDQAGLEIFIPFNTAWRQNSWNMSVVAASRSPELSEEARAEIRFYLRNERRIKPGEPEPFRLEAIQKFLEQFNQTAVTITLVAVGIVGISLIVGGVGIMNIMLVSVSERTREIGLRKAVGARSSAILLQFLVEAITLCLLGGFIGVLGGQALAALVASIPGARLDKATVPGWAVFLAFGFAAGTGLIFGMLPAIKASRLDPIEALRHT